MQKALNVTITIGWIVVLIGLLPGCAMLVERLPWLDKLPGIDAPTSDAPDAPSPPLPPPGDVLVNPMQYGEGEPERAWWKLYEPEHRGRRVTVRWPASMVTHHGVRIGADRNVECTANGITFGDWRMDGDSLRPSCSTGEQWGREFPADVLVLLSKDGQPFAGFRVRDPSSGASFRQYLPTTVQLDD